PYTTVFRANIAPAIIGSIGHSGCSKWEGSSGLIVTGESQTSTIISGCGCIPGNNCITATSISILNNVSRNSADLGIFVVFNGYIKARSDNITSTFLNCIHQRGSYKW